jgi:hypothetical protein
MHKAARYTALAFSLIAWVSPASAAPESTKASVSRSTPSAGPSNSAPETHSALEGNASDADTSLASRLGGQIDTSKIWSIAGGIESHVAIVQTEPDDGRTRGDKLYNFFFLRPQVYVTPTDRLRVDLGMYERFIADPNESGLRLADVAFRYDHYIPLFTGPADALTPASPPSRGVLLQIAASATAPTSYVSQLHGLITVPRLRVYLERAFLDQSLYVSLNGFGEYYVERYRTSLGAGPNALSRYAVEVTADYFVPFHKQLSFGVLAGSSWSYYYGVDGVSSTQYGTVADPQFKTQPVQQIYSAEVDATYSLPAVKGFHTTAALSYAVGDNTVLHDGVQHLYFGFYRRSSELYATLTARY